MGLQRERVKDWCSTDEHWHLIYSPKYKFFSNAYIQLSTAYIYYVLFKTIILKLEAANSTERHLRLVPRV